MDVSKNLKQLRFMQMSQMAQKKVKRERETLGTWILEKLKTKGVQEHQNERK